MPRRRPESAPSPRRRRSSPPARSSTPTTRSAPPRARFPPDSPPRPKPGEPWFGSGRNATGAGATGSSGGSGGGGTSLHAEHPHESHRPLVVGDVLHARGRQGGQWEKQGRSGTLKFTELVTEYLDEHDQVVITARTVAVL